MSDTPPVERFRASVATLRKRRGMSQTALARAMAEAGFDWHQMTVSRVELGRRPIHLGEAFALSEVLSADFVDMTRAADVLPRHDWLMTVHAYGLTFAERDAMFKRVADAAHALDEEISCSLGPMTADYIRTLLENP